MVAETVVEQIVAALTRGDSVSAVARVYGIALENARHRPDKQEQVRQPPCRVELRAYDPVGNRHQPGGGDTRQGQQHQPGWLRRSRHAASKARQETITSSGMYGQFQATTTGLA